MSYFHDNSVSSMSVDFMNELVDALEGAADEGSANDVNDAHDLIEVIKDWVNSEMAANLDGDDATGYQKMFQSWSPADLDITQNLKMFKLNPTRDFDTSLSAVLERTIPRATASTTRRTIFFVTLRLSFSKRCRISASDSTPSCFFSLR